MLLDSKSDHQGSFSKPRTAPKKLKLHSASKTATFCCESVQRLPYATKKNLYDEHWAAKQERGTIVMYMHINNYSYNTSIVLYLLALGKLFIS